MEGQREAGLRKRRTEAEERIGGKKKRGRTLKTMGGRRELTADMIFGNVYFWEIPSKSRKKNGGCGENGGIKR